MLNQIKCLNIPGHDIVVVGTSVVQFTKCMKNVTLKNLVIFEKYYCFTFKWDRVHAVIL